MRRGFLLLLAVFLDCAPAEPLCPEGQRACGATCVDVQFDEQHCGQCGTTCDTGETCQSGECVCRLGHTRCDGECIDVQVSAIHCGACGNLCAGATPFCEKGQCVSSCEEGSPCGFSCVMLDSSAEHCGACDVRCGTAQSCHGGRCAFDGVAACLTTGQVVGFQAQSHFQSAAVSVGQGPQALGVFNDTLLVLDGLDQRLYSLKRYGEPLMRLSDALKTGAVPNQVLVRANEGHVLIVNAGSGTLQVLARENERLTTIAELNVGANTYPEGVAVIGDRAWVPLYGGFGATGAAAGQQVLEVDLRDIRNPQIAHRFDLNALDLEPFEGGNPVPRPWAIAEHRGAIYVALNNLDPDSYEVEGAGLLARIDPATRSLSKVSLGGRQCLNPIWLVSDGSWLWVSCQGKVTYSGPPNYEALSVEGAGVAVLDDTLSIKAFWEATCPEATSCPMVLPSRFAISGHHLYVGDQNSGRLFVLEWKDEQLRELRGYFAGAPPIQACAVNATTKVSNVSDVWVVP